MTSASNYPPIQGGIWRCIMPVKDPPELDEKNKPSQAEGERRQPGEDREEKEFIQPNKPSQAEGERKPYQ